METVEKILASEPADKRHEKLEVLFCKKLKKLDAIKVNSREYYHPEITIVEKNFMVITEEERGFSMSGNIDQYSLGLEEHAHRWDAVGMSGTAFAIRTLAKLNRLNGKIYSVINDEAMADQVSEDVCEIGHSVEEQASGDFENEAILVNYVAENIDQFCRRNEQGAFESLKDDEEKLTISETPTTTLEERLTEFVDPATRVSFESLDLSQLRE